MSYCSFAKILHHIFILNYSRHIIIHLIIEIFLANFHSVITDFVSEYSNWDFREKSQSHVDVFNELNNIICVIQISQAFFEIVANEYELRKYKVRMISMKGKSFLW